jgi:hypothetical protein
LILNADKFAPAKKFPHHFRKVPALAITGALLACLGNVIFGRLIAQKAAEDLGNQNAPALVVVTLLPGSMRAASAPQFLTVSREVWVSKSSLNWPTTVSMTASRSCSDGAKP